jgi:hypothetical protein
MLLFTAVLLLGVPQDEMNILKEEPEISDLITFLEELAQNPFDVNTATVEELSSIPWVSFNLAGQIVGLREERGKFTELEELLVLQEVDRDLLNLISEFLRIGPAGAVRTVCYSGRARTSFGTDGNESRAVRLKASIRSTVAGHAYLKQYVDGSQSVAWSVSLTPFSFVSVTCGDFSLGFGRGLCFDHPGMFEGTSTSRRQLIKPLGLSYGETQMTGGAARLTWHRLGIVTAYSQKKSKARIDEDGYRVLSEGVSATSTVTESTCGERLSLAFGPASVAFSLAHTSFDKPVRRSGGFEEIGFAGSENTVVGVDADYSTPAFRACAEVARSSSGSRGGSVVISVRADGLRLFGVMDNLEPGFHSFHGKHTLLHGVRSARARLERRGSKLKLFIDAAAASDLSPAYGEKVPHSKRKLVLGSSVVLTSILSGDLSFRISSDETDSSGISTRESRCGTELRMDVKLSPDTRLRFGVEKTSSEEESKEGLNFRFDLNRIEWGRLSLKAGWLTYDVEDYSAAIYAYEPPVLGEKSIVLLNGRGSRGYVVCSISITARMRAIVKMTTCNRNEAERSISFELGY